MLVLTGLSSAYSNLGDLAKARDLLEHALKIQDAHYDPNHYQRAVILNNLGSICKKLMYTTKARDLYECALKINETHYGPDHYRVAAGLNNLGSIYGQLGDTGKQRDLLERALKIQEAYYGSNHDVVATTLANLGIAYRDLEGTAVKRRDLLERALAIKQAHYGPDHHCLALTLLSLGNVYCDLGQPVKHCQLGERALKIQEAHYGLDHPELAITLVHLARGYIELQQPSRALEVARRAYSVLIKDPLYGAQHPKTREIVEMLTAICGCTLADLQSAPVGVEKAETKNQDLSVQHMVQLLRSLANDGAEEQNPLNTLLAQLLLPILDPSNVRDNEEEQNFSVNTNRISTATAFDLYQKAGVCLAQGKVDEAISIYESALSEAGGSIVLHNLACAYHVRSRQKQSEDDWRQAYKTFEKAIQFSAKNNTYTEYAQFLYLKGLEQPEKTLFEQAITQLSKALIAEEEGDLCYNWTERETIPSCLRFLLATTEDSFEVMPRLLAYYLLVSCYCHLNELEEAHAALEYLEKAVGVQATAVNECLLAAAKTEYVACQQQCKEERDIPEEKVSYVAVAESKLSALSKDPVLKEDAREKKSVATSVATLLSQEGLWGSHGLQETQIQLGQAVLALVTAIDTQRTVDWDTRAHLSFTATIVSAFAKGQEAFDALCTSPTEHSIPASLGEFIQTYVGQHSELCTLSANPNFANQLKHELIQGNLIALYQRFGVAYPTQKAFVSGMNCLKICSMM